VRRINRAAFLFTHPGQLSNENLLRLGAFLAVSAVVALAVTFRDQVQLDQVGYVGLAITVLIASGGLVLPVPSLATACAAGVLLEPHYVALVAGSAGTMGELTGYFLGFSGRGVLSKSRLYLRLEGWMQRRGWLVIFLFALIPNPIFDFVGIAAGALRYPVWRFLAIVWFGKLLKFLTVAYACTNSVDWLTGLFGV
jgi:membrane protein YqaA with SNARE-associated domain